MNRIKTFFRGLIKNVCFGIKVSFQASEFYFCMKIIILMFTTVVPVVNIWLWKEIINGIAYSRDTDNRLPACLGIYLLLHLSACLIGRFGDYVNERYADEVRFYIETAMMDKTSRTDLSFFDSADMGDRVRRTRGNFGIITRTTWLVFEILSAFINVILTLAIVCAYVWQIGLIMAVLLIPYLVYNKNRSERKLKMEKEQLRDRRRMDYHYNVFFDNAVQFEMKLNDTGHYFIGRHAEIWKKLFRINIKEEIRYNVVNFLMTAVNFTGECLILAISVLKVMNGKMGIGDLQYYVSMAARLGSQSRELIMNVNGFLENNSRLTELQEFLDIVPEVEKSGKRIPSANPEIEFSNVYFRYPNADTYVLKDCSFRIGSHEKISLIGLNGAGKSTIVKLIFRFYDVESGYILLDGIDIKEYDIYALRRVFSVLFQDYVTYCLPLREIIALSDFAGRFDDEKLGNACDMSGFSAVIRDWEDGFDTVLGRFYADGGKDLSGGQWQLLGLARTYFGKGEYMVLDEPSAALDPISEDRIFRQMYRLSAGKSLLMISHRLSNTTLADRILVIEDGCIAEQGSHESLLKTDGLYAHLFRLQADKYV